MARRKAGLPSAWVTWLPDLLAGESHCIWAAWFKSRHWYSKIDDDTFDSVAWNAAHSALVERRVTELKDAGFTVYLEAQNDFRVEGQTAEIVGKPDIVAVGEDMVLVVDAKSGRRRNAHTYQVMLYVRWLAKAFPHIVAGKRVQGEVYYAEGSPVVVQLEDLTPGINGRINSLMQVIGFDIPPERVPSLKECRYCNIPATDCPDRMEPAPVPTATETGF